MAYDFCNKCNAELDYYWEYDCLYCSECDEWSEQKCSDKECEFCNKRPEKPSLAEELKTKFTKT